MLKVKLNKFTIKDLAEILKAEFLYSMSHESQAATLAGISTDSRTTQAGDCFFAITGDNFDGHDYVGNAFAKGAVCAVIEKGIDCKGLEGKCILKVSDTVHALGDLASAYRKEAGYKVVAITGSVGKTTTREMIHHVLSRHFKVHQSPKSFNNKIGLPLTLLGAGEGVEIVIAELGSNHPGEIGYLTEIAAPDIAVVINVHPAHLEGFGDLHTIAREKLSISEGLVPDGVFIINGDFRQLVSFCMDRNIAFRNFGKTDGLDYRAENIRSEGSSSRFTLEGVEVELPLPGVGNIENALAAFAVCRQFDLTAADFAEAVRTFSGASMRAEMLQVGTLTILNDCYNANPASMENALEILAGMDSTEQRRLVFICGDMAELGRQAESLHIELGRHIAEAKVGLVIAVGEFAKIAAEAAQAGAGNDLKIKCFKDTVSACNNLHEIIKDYDIILVKGSRTAKLESAVEKLKEIFS